MLNNLGRMSLSCERLLTWKPKKHALRAARLLLIAIGRQSGATRPVALVRAGESLGRFIGCVWGAEAAWKAAMERQSTAKTLAPPPIPGVLCSTLTSKLVRSARLQSHALTSGEPGITPQTQYRLIAKYVSKKQISYGRESIVMHVGKGNGPGDMEFPLRRSRPLLQRAKLRDVPFAETSCQEGEGRSRLTTATRQTKSGACSAMRAIAASVCLKTALACFFVLLTISVPREKALSIVCSLPPSYFTGETLTAVNLNAPLTTLLNCYNNTDFNNIGGAGIYASQIIPTTTAQATFGGSQTYTFPANVTVLGGFIANPAGVSNPNGLQIGNASAGGGTQYTRIATITGCTNSTGAVNGSLLSIDDQGAGYKLCMDTAGDMQIPGNFLAGTGTFVGSVAAGGNVTGQIGSFSGVVVGSSLQTAGTVTGTGGTFPLVRANGVQLTTKPVVSTGGLTVNSGAVTSFPFGYTYVGGPPFCSLGVQYNGNPTDAGSVFINSTTTTAVFIRNASPDALFISYVCVGQ
jgi:hypothetical protein